MSAPFLPSTAPFSDSQRAWLNGFFAGMTGTQATAGLPIPAQIGTPVEATPMVEAMPWHDAALSMDERLKLAEGKPAPRQLMAAMAQLDCGSCGYICQTYGEAIAEGREKNLALCSPGGKDTSKKLKELVASNLIPVSAVTIGGKSGGTATPTPTAAKFGRNNPFPARLLKNVSLNKSGSDKDTRLIVLDLKHSGLTYNVGDALGVYPDNCPDLVESVLAALHCSGAEDVQGRDGEHTSLREALTLHYSIIRPVGEALLHLLARHCLNPDEAAVLNAILTDETATEAALDGCEILDVLLRYSSARPPAAEFVATLAPLQPRLYSISSSLKAHPDEVHLTVGVVRYTTKIGRGSKGVASCYLSERVRPGQKVRVFIHHAHKFHVPADPAAPLLMVGPGTGIAPFRAFLEERKAVGATGKNWLFFGDQRQATDFLYEEELAKYLESGLLTRLDLAFSRDQAEKIYVQHKMLANAAEIWQWLREGGSFCVCGDAKRMAADVDAALHQIIAEQGNMTRDEAVAYVAEMGRNKRYLRDVY